MYGAPEMQPYWKMIETILESLNVQLQSTFASPSTSVMFIEHWKQGIAGEWYFDSDKLQENCNIEIKKQLLHFSLQNPALKVVDQEDIIIKHLFLSTTSLWAAMFL